MISKELFQLRMRGIKYIISDELVQIEASERNISVEALKEIEIVNKSKFPTEHDIREFKMLNKNANWDDHEIEKIVKEIYLREREAAFENYLYQKYKPEIFLLPPNIGKANTQHLLTFSLNGEDKGLEIILIFDFDCMGCTDDLLRFRQLAKEYTKVATFKLVYLTANYGLPGNALMAARMQGIEIKLLEKMLDTHQDIHDYEFYKDFSGKYARNPDGFIADLDNKTLLRDMLLTRDMLLSLGVFSTPVFIVNGNLYDNADMSFLLEPMIQQLTKKKHKK